MTPTISEAPDIEPVDLRIDRIPSRARWARVGEVGRVLTTRLAPVPVRWIAGGRRRPIGELLGPPLRRSVFDLGVTFVKLAQLVASSPSLAGEALSDAMRGVLDKGPAVPFAEVRAVIERDLGRPLSAVFADFDREPFAAASLAVVHRATLADGTAVAVKVLRPGSLASVRADVGLVQPFAHWLARSVPLAGIDALPAAVDGLTEQLAEELDLRNEARAMHWFAEVVDAIGCREVRVPTPFDDACGPNVLTMEFIDGFPVDDLDAIAANDVDASRAIEALIEAWFAIALCTGTFHGDMHAGNLMLTATGEVVLLDWGIVGRLPDASRRFFRRSIEGALGDEEAWIDVRDHMLATFGNEMLAAAGISLEQFTAMLKYQTTLIMTMPFDQIDLRMLMPAAQMPDQEPASRPSSAREVVRAVRDGRRRARAGAAVRAQATQPRGELLLIKQLVFFERYGKLFLGDQPLLYDPDVYRRLLDRFDPEGQPV